MLGKVRMPSGSCTLWVSQDVLELSGSMSSQGSSEDYVSPKLFLLPQPWLWKTRWHTKGSMEWKVQQASEDEWRRVGQPAQGGRLRPWIGTTRKIRPVATPFYRYPETKQMTQAPPHQRGSIPGSQSHLLLCPDIWPLVGHPPGKRNWEIGHLVLGHFAIWV